MPDSLPLHVGQIDHTPMVHHYHFENKFKFAYFEIGSRQSETMKEVRPKALREAVEQLHDGTVTFTHARQSLRTPPSPI